MRSAQGWRCGLVWLAIALSACRPAEEEKASSYQDEDGDGYAATSDCDDLNPDVSPGAAEVCNDLDDDCDGERDELGVVDGLPWHADADGDGVGSDDVIVSACTQPEGWLSEGGDCDDLRAEVNPTAQERCNGLDDDCDGDADEIGAIDGNPAYYDADGDGFGDPAESGRSCSLEAPWVANALDCDDADPHVWTGATEVCDDKDNDCDGRVDIDAEDGTIYYRDVDNDGRGDPEDTTVDCALPSGFARNAGDCDDADPDINDRETEVCDGVDNDCSGAIDDDATDGQLWYLDSDADGYGDAATEALLCSDPYGSDVHVGGDCDDADAAVNPAAEETWYDGWDQDCAGDSDWDRDQDGYVLSTLEDPDQPTYDPGTGEIVDVGVDTEGGDCDDSDAETSPGATETCEGTDQDCDGAVDEDAADARTWYWDEDGDAFGVTSTVERACEPSAGSWSVYPGDCDDADGFVGPGVEETWYDGWDQDCRGDSDWDQDADGYVLAELEDAGEPTYDPGTGAVIEAGETTDAGDCDDLHASIYPGKSERCDGADQDCDGEVDEDASDALTWYPDEDADGYGGDLGALEACDRPSARYDTVGGDCDDSDSAINPDAEEIWYDGWDQDCAADSDWDQDDDGYVTSALEDADEPTYDPGSGEIVDYGRYTRAGDCDDESRAIRPGVTELCDGQDNDCDGEIDTDASSADTWYTDSDGDGYGLDGSGEIYCLSPGDGFASRDGDCDDAAAEVNAGEVEVCDGDDGLDNDCDGEVDLVCDTGWVRYAYGNDADPEVRTCDLYWSARWALSSESCGACDCDWTFEVTLTYEPTLSDNSGGCVDPSDADQVWVLGLKDTIRYRSALLWSLDLEADTCDTFSDAALDGESGRLTFSDGLYEELADGLYTTDYWSGSAELYELVR